MSIKFQKIIRWIPYFNLLSFFYGLVYLFRNGKKISMKAFLAVFGILLLITIPEILVNSYIPIVWIQNFIGIITRYFHSIVFSSFGIWMQRNENA